MRRLSKHIVIIEDDAALLQTLDYLLTEAGFRVTTLRSLVTPEHLADLQADCFVLDEHLPFVNGHVICIMLKSMSKTSNIPVILMSAYEELAGIATQCKAESYIKKPFADTAHLPQLIRSVLVPEQKIPYTAYHVRNQ